MSAEDPIGLSEAQIRETLESILDSLKEPYTWHTGEVRFELDSGASIAGKLKGLEPASAIIDGPRGLQSVLLKHVRNVAFRMRSPGPE